MNVLPQKFMVVIWLLLITEAHSSEWFQIERKISDVFTIPPSQCKGLNYCGRYNAQEYGKNCSCYCPAQSATFAFHQNSWKCVDNQVVRDLFAGCKKRTFFQNEVKSQQLRVVNAESLSKNLLLKGTCSVNLAASWSTRCHRIELSPRERIFHDAFRIQWDAQFSVNRLEIDLADGSPLQGKIINLGIQCGGATTFVACLLFKMEGATNCSVTGLHTTNAKTTASNIPSTTQVTKGPAEKKQRSGCNILLPVAVIAGVVVLLGVLGLSLFCFWRKKRPASLNKPGKSLPATGTSQIPVTESTPDSPELPLDQVLEGPKDQATSDPDYEDPTDQGTRTMIRSSVKMRENELYEPAFDNSVDYCYSYSVANENLSVRVNKNRLREQPQGQSHIYQVFENQNAGYQAPETAKSGDQSYEAIDLFHNGGRF